MDFKQEHETVKLQGLTASTWIEEGAAHKPENITTKGVFLQILDSTIPPPNQTWPQPIQKLLSQYANLFNPPKQPTPHRSHDHTIPLTGYRTSFCSAISIPLFSKRWDRKDNQGATQHGNNLPKSKPLFISRVVSKNGGWDVAIICGLQCLE